ncbi:MAG: nucleotidyltransferase domain-containing protein [Campylobacterota bacterium]|nr:nucleotidyltransferase domain-containing protein [Campylobacterota bacterium]
MTKSKIIEVLKSKKDAYCLKNFILFGSVANGTNTNDSDIDIAYIENEKVRLNYDNYLKLEDELKKIFNAKIDLINYKKFNPLIKLHSQKEFIYV